MNRPPKAYWDAAVKAIRESGTAADPEKVAGNLWYHVLTPAQRRKWMKGEAAHHSPSELSAQERAAAEARLKMDRAAGLLEHLIDRSDPQAFALLAAGVAGWVGVDIADDLWAGLDNAWNNFWRATPFGGGASSRYGSTETEAEIAAITEDDLLREIFGPQVGPLIGTFLRAVGLA